MEGRTHNFKVPIHSLFYVTCKISYDAYKSLAPKQQIIKPKRRKDS